MKKVIIVEDDISMILIVSWILEKSGDLLIRSTPKTVWQYTLHYRPQLLILNDRYSTGEWHHFFEKIRNNLDTKDIPVIVYSIFSPVDKIAKQYNADAFFEKPFELESFTVLVDSLLGKEVHIRKDNPN